MEPTFPDHQQRPEPFWTRNRDLLLVLMGALGLRLLVAAMTANTYDPDEFVWLALGRYLGPSAVPYRDYMTFQPPGMLVLVHLLQPLTTLWWPLARMTEALLDTATAGMIWRIGTLLYGRREALAAGILYAVSPVAMICSVRVELDPVITFFGVAGLTILLSTRAWKGSALAGVCLALAVWTKYPALIFAPIYVLAAPRRAIICAGACLAALAILFAPFLPEARQVLHDTVAWQLGRRHSMALHQKLVTVFAYWLLVNPLAVPALLLRRRYPAWLIAGFLLGGAWLLSSQVYYHYMATLVPFTSLLAAPLAVQIVRFLRVPAPAIAAACVGIAVFWSLDINMGVSQTRLYVTRMRFSDIRGAIRILDHATRPGDTVLADHFEYAYLANRHPDLQYFWNVATVVDARYLVRRLPNVAIVIHTWHQGTVYPDGFVQYLSAARYRPIEVGRAEVWLRPRARASVDPARNQT